VQAATGLVLIASLLAQEVAAPETCARILSRSLQLLVVCLPLLVLLFLFVPRLGPLGPHAELGRARTGLSDQLDPGAIAQLAQDPSPALRISPDQASSLPPADRALLAGAGAGSLRWPALARRQAPGPCPRPWGPPATTKPGAPQQLWLVEPSPLSALPWAAAAYPSNPQITSTAKGELEGPWQTLERRSYVLAARRPAPRLAGPPPRWCRPGLRRRHQPPAGSPGPGLATAPTCGATGRGPGPLPSPTLPLHPPTADPRGRGPPRSVPLPQPGRLSASIPPAPSPT
jgi:hypothetical protein